MRRRIKTLETLLKQILESPEGIEYRNRKSKEYQKEYSGIKTKTKLYNTERSTRTMDKFKEIFEGNNSAYGIMRRTGEVTDKGKAVAKAQIKRVSLKVVDYLWQDHLDGKDPALGIIPINENNMCRWGCIDIDEYNLDHLNVMLLM